MKFKSFSKNLLRNLIEFQNYSSFELNRSKLSYTLLFLHTAQLTTILFPTATEVLFKYPLLSAWLNLLTASSPLNWLSLSTTVAIKIFFIVYLLLLLLSQIGVFLLASQQKNTDLVKPAMFIYRILGTIFEYVIFIPIMSWLLLDKTPGGGPLQSYVLDKSPTWLYVVIAALLGITTILHLFGKVFEIPFRYLHEDLIKSSELSFDIIRTLAPIPIIVLSMEAGKKSVITSSPNILSCIYAFIAILMGMRYHTYRKAFTRKLHILLMASYFVHSLFMLILVELPQTSNRKFIDVSYFISISFVLWGCVAGMKLLQSGRSQRETDVLSEMEFNSQIEQIQTFFEVDRLDSSVKTSFKLKTFINNHFDTCANETCFCRSWTDKRIYSSESSEFFEAAYEFLEVYYEELLKQRLRTGSLRAIDMIGYLFLQSVHLEKYMKAFLTWSHFRVSVKSFYHRVVLEALIKYIEGSFILTLSPTERDYYTASFYEGISFDKDYKNCLKEIQHIKNLTNVFYRYLVESTTVMLDKLYTNGNNVIIGIRKTEEKLNHLITTHKKIPDAIALMIHFKGDILKQGRRSLMFLQSRYAHLLAKKHARMVASLTQRTFTNCTTRFDYHDVDNVYLAVDLTRKFGTVRSHNSRLEKELGYLDAQLEGGNLRLAALLPEGVGSAAIRELQAFIKQPKSIVETKNYLNLVLLSNKDKFLVPFQSHIKTEIAGTELFGVAALKKIVKRSDYILTKASGEIISSTKKFCEKLGLRSMDELKGVNLCLLVPKLLRHYLEIPAEASSLYPDEGNGSAVISTVVYRHEDLSESNIKKIAPELIDATHLMRKLNNLKQNEVLEEEDVASIHENFSSLSRKNNLEVQDLFEIILKIQRYVIGGVRFKVIEVFDCRSISELKRIKSLEKRISVLDRSPREPIRTETGFTNQMTIMNHQNTIMNHQYSIQVIQEGAEHPLDGQEEESDLQEEGEIPNESVDLSVDLDFFSPERKGGAHILEPVLPKKRVPSKKFKTEGRVQFRGNKHLSALGLRLGGHPGPRDPEKKEVPEVLTTMYAKIFQEALKRFANLALPESSNEPKTGNSAIFSFSSFEQIFGNRMNGEEVLSSNDSDDGKNEVVDKPNVSHILNRKNVTRAPSSRGSTASSFMHERISTRGLLEANFNYRFLRVYQIAGLIGVAMVVLLFAAQYSQYNVRLAELTLLSNSMNNPMQLGLSQNLVSKQYYKWELITRGFFDPEDWYLVEAQTVTTGYLNISKNFFGMLMNANNVSEEVSRYLYDEENYIAINYVDGSEINMSIPQAFLLLHQAGTVYHDNQMINALNNSETISSGYLLDANAESLYDMLFAMNADIVTAIQGGIQSIQDFNTLSIAIIAAIMGFLTICCLGIFIIMVRKRIRMLSLFCKIPRQALAEEWKLMNEHNNNNSLEAARQDSGSRDQAEPHKRMFSRYKYRMRYKWAIVVVLVVIYVLFMLPFLLSTDFIRKDIKDWNYTVQQADIWRRAQAKASAFMQQDLKFYFNINATEERKQQIYQRQKEQLQGFLQAKASLSEFVTAFGTLPNQGVYDEVVTQQILGGRNNLTHWMHDDNNFTTYCSNVANGIGNQGVLQVANYFVENSEDIFNAIYGASDPLSALRVEGEKPGLLDTEFLGLCFNRLLRITADKMTLNFGAFMEGVKGDTLHAFIAISVMIVVMLGTMWIYFINRVEKWLNQAKKIYIILPPNILQSHTIIRGYFKREYSQTKRICC